MNFILYLNISYCQIFKYNANFVLSNICWVDFVLSIFKV